MAQRALMRAVPSLRENGNDMIAPSLIEENGPGEGGGGADIKQNRLAWHH